MVKRKMPMFPEIEAFNSPVKTPKINVTLKNWDKRKKTTS